MYLGLPFSGMSVSTWEHMKLLFWPLFLFMLAQRLFFKGQENCCCLKPDRLPCQYHRLQALSYHIFPDCYNAFASY